MKSIEKWIWLPKAAYPEYQNTSYACSEGTEYTVAEFVRSYAFDQEIECVCLRFSGDTEYVLYCNGQMLATGPISVGGDFLGDELPRNRHYATEMSITPHTKDLNF